MRFDAEANAKPKTRAHEVLNLAIAKPGPLGPHIIFFFFSGGGGHPLQELCIGMQSGTRGEELVNKKKKVIGHLELQEIPFAFRNAKPGSRRELHPPCREIKKPICQGHKTKAYGLCITMNHNAYSGGQTLGIMQYARKYAQNMQSTFKI